MLPTFLAHDYDHPFVLNRGTELALLQTLDLLTAARRKEGVCAEWRLVKPHSFNTEAFTPMRFGERCE